MPRRSHLSVTALCLATLTTGASGQSFNIDFGSGGPAPSATYAAAGEAGEWNAVPGLASGVRFPLVDTGGVSNGVDIRQIGGLEILESDDPATTGDDAALLDDMFISVNDPLDLCIWIDNLENGRYEVLTYALTPNDPDLESRVRVDFADQGPVMIGGAWTGGHVEGVSYARHTVDVTGGEIGLHSGLVQAVIQSGINAIQISRIDLVGVAETPAIPGMLGHARPNPFRSRVAVELSIGGAAITALQVLDVGGRLVRHLNVPGGGGALTVVWDGRDAAGRETPAGVYFLRALGEDGRRATRKLVRQE